METPEDPGQLLAEAERAAAAPYVDYPPTPAWYPPAVGAWAATLLGAATLTHHPLVQGGLLLVAIVAEGGFLAWYRRYRGTAPSLRHVPREVGRAMVWFVLGAGVVAAAVSLAAWLLPAAAALLVTFVLVTVGVAAYERHYARAAAATRARLA